MIRLQLLLGILISSLLVKADEGMWIPSLLNKYTIEDMQKAGFKLSAEDVYDINQVCLKDAIVGLGRSSDPTTFSGSGSFISSTGLVLTNHHCAVSYLHKHSSVENNYLRNGFYASNKGAELQAKGLTLSRLVRMEDVTEELKAGTDLLEGRALTSAMNIKGKSIVEASTTDLNLKGRIKSYFGGAQYFLEIFEVYRDVRIVAMPPISIGKFGGEEDNWQWPRNSADFCVLRVYGNEDNLSIKYSESNTPIAPTNFLELSKKGFKEDDFAMVYGFPGQTKQFLTSTALQQLVDVTNFHSIKIRDAKMDVVNRNMAKNEELWLKYADVKEKTSNSLLRWKAESSAIKRFGVIESKRKEEQDFLNWVNETEERKSAYGDILPSIESVCQQLDTLEKVNAYVNEAGISGANLTSFVAKFDMIHAISSRKKVDEARLKKELNRMEKETISFFQKYDINVEREMLTNFVRLYGENVGDKNTPAPIVEARKKYNGDYKQYVDDLFQQSIFVSQDKIEHFLASYSKKDLSVLEKDPLLDLCISYYVLNLKQVYRKRVDIRREYGKYHKRYVQAIREMKKNEKLAPDANRSLRVSFGTISGYNTDSVPFSYISTLSELLEKYNRDSITYEIPENFVTVLKKQVKKKDFPTCFITTAHTTGGNSGSAVLDKKGQLIGLNFDRAAYGLVSDYKYIEDCSRNISVDVRYIRFVLEHQLKADALLKEWN